MIANKENMSNEENNALLNLRGYHSDEDEMPTGQPKANLQLFCNTFLLLVLISKGYYGKQLNKDTEAAQRNLDQHSAEFIEAKARLELVTRRFKMAERLADRQLKETQNATKVIRIKEKINE